MVDNYSGDNVALFATDNWRINQWVLDAGFRVEQQQVSGTIENDTNEAITANPLSLWNTPVERPERHLDQLWLRSDHRPRQLA